MNNHAICVQWVLDRLPTRSSRVLDYGCGAGEIVTKLRANGVDAFGCDVYYEGGDHSSTVDPALLGSVIKRMQSGTIPFHAESFDIVISNQVLEHVENLDAVLSEMRRVMRPGALVLSIFPDAGVWREGHCGIPFLHWFPRGSRFRIYYAAALRALGLGYFPANKPAIQWSSDFCDWLDKWTFYRTRREIDRAFGRHFCNIAHVEDYWLKLRLSNHSWILPLLPASVKRLVVRKLGGLVFEAKRID